MKIPRLLVAALTCTGLGAAAAPVRAATTSVSSNWAGYAVTGRTFRHVTGTWVVPTLDCSSGAGYSAAWVGLGGYAETSQALEQTGTEADCNGRGAAHYSAWYELVPSPAVTGGMTVRAGDRISASVDVLGTRVRLHLSNLTTGASLTKSARMSSPETSSAEWIVEAPSACDAADRCSQLPLGDFGTVSFTRAAATTAAGHTGAISDPAWRRTRIALDAGRDPGPGPGRHFVDLGASGGATASTLSSAGRSFSISYRPSG
jgi:Peptidase A4 family